jgi:hypothetical protein
LMLKTRARINQAEIERVLRAIQKTGVDMEIRIIETDGTLRILRPTAISENPMPYGVAECI